jgi:sugar diacid utilization regulator
VKRGRKTSGIVSVSENEGGSFGSSPKQESKNQGGMKRLISFLSTYIPTISELNDIGIGCWDANLIPLFPVPVSIGNCEQYKPLLSHALKIQRPLSYSTERDNGKLVVSIVPVIKDDIRLLIVLAGKNEEANLAIGESIAALVFGISRTFLGLPEPTSEDKHAKLITNLLIDQPDISTILKLSKSLEWDNSLEHAVLAFKFQRNTGDYFNINLDLGYTSSEERIKDSVVATIKRNKYLSSQDLVSVYLDNYIIVIKSLYKENEKLTNQLIIKNIALSILNSLEEFPTLFFVGSCGTIKSEFLELNRSFVEAKNLILHKDNDLEKNAFVSPEDVLIETVFSHLESSFTEFYLEALAEILINEDPENPRELLEIAEAYVDNAMNYSQTSKKIKLHRNTVNMKVEKFMEITALNPQKSFKDALSIKLLALYTSHGD